MPKIDFLITGLDEAIEDLELIPTRINTMSSRLFRDFWEDILKPEILRIIDTGEGMVENVPWYAAQKQALYGVGHPLGYLSGQLYRGVDRTHMLRYPGLTGIYPAAVKDLKMSVDIKSPWYAGIVHDGAAGKIIIPPRPFIEVALKNKWSTFVNMLHIRTKNILKRRGI